jgi:hypothetical protein
MTNMVARCLERKLIERDKSGENTARGKIITGKGDIMEYMREWRKWEETNSKATDNKENDNKKIREPTPHPIPRKREEKD